MSTERMPLARLPQGWCLAVDEVDVTDQRDLWSACTDRDRPARWTAPDRGELRVGGSRQALADGDVRGAGRVLACDPPRSFTTEWTAEGEAPTVLTVEPEPVPGGTPSTRA